MHISQSIFPRSPYLCNVFFIVLDLRLTKVGVQRYSFFYVRTFRMSRFSRLYYIVNRNKMRKIICHAECPFPAENPFDYDGDFPKLLSSFTYVPLDDNTSRFFRKPILFYYKSYRTLILLSSSSIILSCNIIVVSRFSISDKSSSSMSIARQIFGIKAILIR